MPSLHRLFFAVRPPEAARPYFLDEQRYFGPGLPVREEHLHITAVISNDYAVYPSAVEKRMISVGKSVVAERFPIILDQVAASGHSVVMCPSEPLRSFVGLYRLLVLGMMRIGVPIRAGWRSSPHATLLYRRGKPFRFSIDPMSWMVNEFVLIHSHVGFTEHRELGRWPLLPRA